MIEQFSYPESDHTQK